jgi:RNA polymerase sigma-70 factor (ECF subfamily)
VVKSSADAEDVVQEAFIRLWRWPDFDALESPRAVLYKTAFRLALNRLREGAANPLDRADGLDEAPLCADAATPEETLIARERERAFRDAVRGLPPRCRQIVELRAGENRSYKEISATLHVAVSTLEKHMARAKRVCVMDASAL